MTFCVPAGKSSSAAAANKKAAAAGVSAGTREYLNSFICAEFVHDYVDSIWITRHGFWSLVDLNDVLGTINLADVILHQCNRVVTMPDLCLRE